MAVLSIADCMKRHNMSRDTITREFRKKGSPAYKIGIQWQVEEEEWIAFLKKESEKFKG